MDIEINEELRAYIDPLTEDEHAALERSLLAEGCRDALVLWGNLLVDGHNRHAICKKHGIEFRTVQNTMFQSLDDVRLWMIDNHLGRRSISDFQRGVLALRKKDILQSRTDAPAAGEVAPRPEGEGGAAAAAPRVVATRESVAKAARLSTVTVGQIEKIQQEAAPELVAAVKSGAISINAAAAVASLPAEQQRAAVAGGRQELRRAAREVREKKAAARPRRESAQDPEGGQAADAAGADPLAEGSDPVELNRVIRALREENAALRQRVAHMTIALKEARG